MLACKESNIEFEVMVYSHWPPFRQFHIYQFDQQKNGEIFPAKCHHLPLQSATPEMGKKWDKNELKKVFKNRIKERRSFLFCFLKEVCKEDKWKRADIDGQIGEKNNKPN